MCSAILRVTYRSGGIQDHKISEAAAVDPKISELKSNEQVLRIEVFRRTDDFHRVVQWVNEARKEHEREQQST